MNEKKRAVWIDFFQKLPEGIEILKVEEAEVDDCFEIEIWAPKEARNLAIILSKFPAKTTIEKLNEGGRDDEVIIMLWVPLS